MTPLDFVVVAITWAILMAFRQTRTVRTVALLAALTAVYVGAASLANPWRLTVRVSLVAVAAGVVLRYPWLVWSLSRTELDYDEFIHDIAEGLHRLNQPLVWDRAEWERLADEYRAAARKLEERSIPHPAWDALRQRFLDHLRFNLDVYEGRLPADEASRDQAAGNWALVRIEWKRVRMMRSTFWR